jgi:hypothetical protein
VQRAGRSRDGQSSYTAKTNRSWCQSGRQETVDQDWRQSDTCSAHHQQQQNPAKVCNEGFPWRVFPLYGRSVSYLQIRPTRAIELHAHLTTLTGMSTCGLVERKFTFAARPSCHCWIRIFCSRRVLLDPILSHYQPPDYLRRAEETPER